MSVSRMKGARTPHGGRVPRGETGNTVLMAGEDLLEARVEGPARIIDPAPAVEPLADFRSAVRRALASPRGMPPLGSLVSQGSRVAVAFDDPCLPLPPPVYDPRRTVLEEVLVLLSAEGVRDQDVDLVCANGLHRSWSRAELLPLVGPRVMRRYGRRLRCYDGEDPEGNTRLSDGSGDGPIVEVDSAVARADLVVYVAVPWTEMNGGHKSIACGLSTYASIRQHHGPDVQAHSPLMDPERSHMHDMLRRIGAVVGNLVPVFQVETVMNTRLWAGPFGMLDVHRPTPSPAMRLARRLPWSVRRRLRRAVVGWYRPAGVWAGAVDPVHEAALDMMARTRGGPEHQADILVLSVPGQSPYAVHSEMNPVLVANLGLGYAFQFGRPEPLVRPGGWVVLVSPCREEFHRRHHRAYVRFWEEVLPRTRDSSRMAAEFEPAFVADLALLEAYRRDRAYHPAHPFFIWYWMERARRHVGGVVIAGAEDPGPVAALGFQWAPDVQSAIAEARRHLGADAEVAVHHLPPIFTVDVSG